MSLQINSGKREKENQSTEIKKPVAIFKGEAISDGVIEYEPVTLDGRQVKQFPRIIPSTKERIVSDMMENVEFAEIQEHNNLRLHVAQTKINILNGKNEAKASDVRREIQRANHFSRQYNVDVYLLDETDSNRAFIPSTKNPDVYSEGVFIELKESNGSESSVQNRMKRAVTQAEAMYININKSDSKSTLNNVIEHIVEQIQYCKDAGMDLEDFWVFVSVQEGEIRSYKIENGRLLSLPFPVPRTNDSSLANKGYTSESGSVNNVQF